MVSTILARGKKYLESIMTSKEFEIEADKLIRYCSFLLFNSKAKEYSRGNDRLSTFKRAAALKKCTPERALEGMKIKHTISIYDMLDDLDIGKHHSLDKWKEKIGDEINYLILLYALLIERAGGNDDIR